MQSFALPVELPLNYRRVTLQQLRDQHEAEEHDAPVERLRITKIERLRMAKKLFYCGNFTKCLQDLLATSDDFLVDTVHISVVLLTLGVVKTKFTLTKLLYDEETRLLVKNGVRDLQEEYTSKCLDVQALFSFYLG